MKYVVYYSTPWLDSVSMNYNGDMKIHRGEKRYLTKGRIQQYQTHYEHTLDNRCWPMYTEALSRKYTKYIPILITHKTPVAMKCTNVVDTVYE